MAAARGKQSIYPFDAVEAVWSPATASSWVFRTYLSQTIDGFLRAFFEAGENAELLAGLLHVPGRLSHILEWWPSEGSQGNHQIYQMDRQKGGQWHGITPSFRPQSGHGQELWAAWTGKRGCGLLIARRPTSHQRGAVLPIDAWQMLLTWSPDCFLDGIEALGEVLADHPETAEILDRLQKTSSLIQPERRQTVNPILRSALTLADHMDPWTRRQITESTWINLLKQVQENVAWELRIERLLPAIGETIRETISYDFCEILIFSKPGKRHEEFLSWRRNTTGYGGKGMTMLLNEKLVAKLVRDRKPRLIGTTEDDGLMNPHLAEIARLKEGLIIPLVHEKKVLGILSLFYQYPTGLQQRELERMSQVGQVIARSVENSNAHENMRRMATIDPLTSLHNRRSFTESILREMRRSQRYNQRFALIMIDIDNFKNYNDTNGHLQGDHLLQQFAEILRNSVRAQDLVARYGGEEFAIILPHTSIDDGYTVAEKIRVIVEDTDFPLMETQPTGFVSISLGISDTDQGAQTHTDLIAQADLALYAAKERGRNQSVKYQANLASQS